MSQYIQNLSQKKPDLIPSDFIYITYLNLNPDLKQHGILTEENAIRHYIVYGKKEHRFYKYEKLHDGTVDSDFDAEFYLSEYPDVASYCHGMTNVEEKEKLFHHYIHYGKYEGRFKNSQQYLQSINLINLNISTFIDAKTLIAPQNELQAICLLTTDKEIENKQLEKFLDQIIKYTNKSTFTQNIYFNIIVNNQYKHFESNQINDLKKIFKQVNIIDLKLTEEADIYVNKETDIQKVPEYGLKSGPNISFFKTIQLSSIYNTILCLETDCLLSDNWLENIYLYTKYANGFLISGAIYDGSTPVKAASSMMNHINGGTGLYATGHPVLQKVISLCEDFLKKQVSDQMPGLAYDYALKLFIDLGLDHNYMSKIDREIWQFIYRNYLPCKLIINCSTDKRSLSTINLLQTKYNYSVLHIK